MNGPDFQRVFLCAPSPMLLLAPDFRIVDFNEGFQRVSGFDRAGVVGRDLFAVVAERFGEGEGQRENMLAMRTSLERVLRFRVADELPVQRFDVAPNGDDSGERYWRSINTPVFDGDGVLTHLLHRVEDVSEFVRLGRKSETQARTVDALGERNAALESEIRLRRATEDRLRFHESIQTETGRIAKVGGWSFDPATGEGYWTDEVARIHGLDPRAYTSRDIGLSYYHDEHRERIEAALKGAVEDGLPFDLELELHAADGSVRWVRTIGHPVFEDGRVVRLYGSFQDISEIKAGQQAAERQRRRLALLADVSRRLVVKETTTRTLSGIFDDLALELGTEVYAFLEAVDASPNLRLVCSEGLDTEDRPDGPSVLRSGSALCEQVARRRESILVDETTAQEAGSSAELVKAGIRAYSGHPLVASGRLIGTVCFASRSAHVFTEGDQHLMKAVADQVAAAFERRRLLEGLRRSEGRLRGIFDAVFAHVFLVSTDGRLLEANRAFVETTPWTKAELIGRPLAEGPWWAHAASQREHITRLVERAARGEVLRTELSMRGRDGEAFPVDAVFSPLLGEAGQVLQVVGFGVDVRERKRAEEEVRVLAADLERRVAERTAQLQASNRELEAFSYTISHDLRAPVRAVDGYAGALVEDLGETLPEDALAYVSKIRAGARRMGDLIDDLLGFARLSRVEIQPVTVDVKALVAEVVEESAAELGNRDVRIACGDLPPCRGDRALLRQVWSNLLGNAQKYTRKRAVAEIEIHGEVRECEVVYRIKDNGAGFDMRHADKLFGVFQRLHHEHEFEGTGVGLAVVRRIVERHDGRTWASGERGKGAEFFFALPFREGE
ncbi:PAS domain S-box protein [Congregicoccus parvus]|uniref:PAS domain S-box protein n=1 Tax=Congregicoccus parvus TaxID=3081749 RepID=UPI003FA59403